MIPLDEDRIRRFGHKSAVDNCFHHSGTTYEDVVCMLGLDVLLVTRLVGTRDCGC